MQAVYRLQSAELFVEEGRNARPNISASERSSVHFSSEQLNIVHC